MIAHIQLLVDNCTDQNENGFLLMYLCWRKAVRFNDKIKLTFNLILYIRNGVDGSLGHFKRRLKTSNMRLPRETINLIDRDLEQILGAQHLG